MLRNLNKEFRGNGLPDELYSGLVRNGAVVHMKNACSPSPEDVKMLTPVDLSRGGGPGAVRGARRWGRADGRRYRQCKMNDR